MGGSVRLELLAIYLKGFHQALGVLQRIKTSPIQSLWYLSYEPPFPQKYKTLTLLMRTGKGHFHSVLGNKICISRLLNNQPFHAFFPLSFSLLSSFPAFISAGQHRSSLWSGSLFSCYFLKINFFFLSWVNKEKAFSSASQTSMCTGITWDLFKMQALMQQVWGWTRDAAHLGSSQKKPGPFQSSKELPHSLNEMRGIRFTQIQGMG